MTQVSEIFYNDTGLINGLEYTYAVTSFDTGNPKTGLISMESNQIEAMVHVVPRAQPIDYQEPTAEIEQQAQGSVTIEPMVLAPDKVTGHQYKIVWSGAKQTGPAAYITGPGYQPPIYEIIDTTTNQTVVKRQPFDWYDPLHQEAVEVLSPMFDGIVLKITGVDVSYGSPTENPINDVKLTAGTVTGWGVNIQSPGTGENTWPNIFWTTYYRPHTYSITFVDDTHVKVVDEDTGAEIQFNDQRADGYAILTGSGWRDEYVPAETPGFFRIFIRGGYLYIKDPNGEISAGDVFTVEMGGVSAPQDGDQFLLSTEYEVGSTTDSQLTIGDVNQDGQVSILDMILVSQDFGKDASANPQADVNDDGIISILDLILVARHLGESTAAAPALIAINDTELDPALIQAWIERAQAEDDGSAAFQQGIAKLQQLLASLIPEETALFANYPNPFNPETWIPYQLAEPTEVTLHIYGVSGVLVRTLDLGYQVAGIYQHRNRAAYWDGKNEVGESVASGIYFYTLTTGDFTVTRKMLIRK